MWLASCHLLDHCKDPASPSATPGTGGSPTPRLSDATKCRLQKRKTAPSPLTMRGPTSQGWLTGREPCGEQLPSRSPSFYQQVHSLTTGPQQRQHLSATQQPQIQSEETTQQRRELGRGVQPGAVSLQWRRHSGEVSKVNQMVPRS